MKKIIKRIIVFLVIANATDNVMLYRYSNPHWCIPGKAELIDCLMHGIYLRRATNIMTIQDVVIWTVILLFYAVISFFLIRWLFK